MKMKAISLAIFLALFSIILSRDANILTTHESVFDYDCSQAQNNKSSSEVELLTSNHVLDQLITRIFAIILRDIFDYNVTIRSYEINHQTCKTDRDKVLGIFDLMEDRNDLASKTVVHLSMWMSAMAHRLIPDMVIEHGSAITPGRFGWFVPQLGMFIANSSKAAKFKLDSDIFNDPSHKYYNIFMLNDEIDKQLLITSDIESKFISPQCANRTCVALLAEFHCDTDFIEKQIIDSKSYLNVYWLGSHFRQKINNLISYYQENSLFDTNTFIVLHWMPSDVITSTIAFKQFHMPMCEDMTSLQRSYCKYELTPILKYATKSVQSIEDNHVINELRDFTINDTLLHNLFKIYEHTILPNNTSVEYYNTVACKWLNKYNYFNSRSTSKNKAKLYIGAIFPLGNTHRGYHNLSFVANKAADAINQNSSILSNFELIIYTNDCQCRTDNVMKAFLHYFNIQNLLGVLGPACSETMDPIASISKHTNMPLISYAVDGLNFTNRNEYPYVFRTIGSNHQFIDVYINVLKEFGWSRIAALTEEGVKSVEYISYMEAEMNKINFKLVEHHKLISDISATKVKQYLTDLKTKHLKIIVVDIIAYNLANLILCEAYKLEMTAYDGYVWFLPHWVSRNIEPSANCSQKQLEKAFEGHFSITHSTFGNSQSLMQEGISVQDWVSNVYGNNTDISNYVGFVYDAVWTYALVADKFLKDGGSAYDIMNSKSIIDQVVKLIWQTDFQGLSGRVRFGQGGTRINVINITQWINHTYIVIGFFEPTVTGSGEQLYTDGGNLTISENKITWLWKQGISNDGSRDCFLGNLFTINCETANTFFSPTICTIFTLITFSLSYFFWKRRYQRKFQSSVKIMQNFGIDFTALQYKKLTSLKKWEIAKDKIVANRRLGQGAFGDVYGGEAFFDSKGWVAVAIKSLKMGASVEDRLDFLSEADAMKCLDHENIIKMLGVSLQSEPIYTVMEYMLYGDLKTFLQSRRNMAREKYVDENSDISPKQLTTYALHIVNGLEYLANQKYIHRDIACRNCLVNAQRIVKLGDFGMSKSIVESEYYRFSHKRMLPVRWMAPECLHSGLFTSASDIWSYGIVLFEIITFGNLPYHGLSNKQVFQYVSKGNSLKLPLGIKQQLSSLIQACLSQEADKRPTASDIISYISNYPCLLTACLDFTATSIEHTDTDYYKMEMVPDTQSVMTSSCYSASYMSQSIPTKPFDRNNIFSANAELSSFNTINDDEDDKSKPTLPSSFSITPPDGYSIMCPLLTTQIQHASNST